MQTHLHIAIPILAEEENVKQIIQLFDDALYPHKHLWICVNQPDAWHDNSDHRDEVLQNRRSLEYLLRQERTDITVMDHSSPGLGWKGRKHGVGMARKSLMDAIAEEACADDIIVSMDADTTYAADYYDVVAKRLQLFPSALAVAVPYYHPLPHQSDAARAILRYEIYMRYYALNMYSRNIPYARTALGSAIALRVWAYKRVGGMTPHAGGEDFYLLQKLAKAGDVIDYCDAVVYPSGRFSSRVPIGTGPAMIKGAGGDWSGYPFYPPALFHKVKKTFGLFEELYEKDLSTPMTTFLQSIFREEDIWGPLRKNFKTRKQFVRACHQKVDGLRIRQFMRRQHLDEPTDDLTVLNTFLREKYATFVPESGFENTPVERLDAIRETLFRSEQEARKTHDENYSL